MADNMDPAPSSEEEEYNGLEEGQDEEEKEEKEDQDEEEGEEEEEDQDEEAGEDEDDEEDHGCRAVVLFPPNKPKNEVKEFYKVAFDAEDMQEDNDDDDGHYLSFYVPGFSFDNKDFPYDNHDITRFLFNVKNENDNDKLYYESLEARSKRGFHSWSSLKHQAKAAGMTLKDDGITMWDRYHNTWTLVGPFNTPEGSIEGEKEEENDEDDGYDSECDYQKDYNKSDEEDVGPDPEGTYNDDSDDA